MAGSGLRFRFAAAALAASLAGLSAAAARAEEPVAMNAFAVWTSEGAVTRTAEKKLAMASALTGTLFVETPEGPVDTGRIVCPAMVQVETETGHQSGNGFCTFTAYDGAQAFGTWECTGVHLVGCSGKFQLTGGTGRLATIKGSSSLVLRGRFHELDVQLGKAASYTVSGIALWRDLRLESQ
ncbi:hypothetical protein FHP25_36135 [Vineibacter terrae]|uniref:DUF3617 family protein n=1 Tax=Vineibacter terrae TaxID=2586908 RepID=A0A5C8P9Z8_9HYPH|nr:hypothetical protein [Vineibacter terrae]TXL70047.1 hypothetical protein FHP25_36135 [Vineibacter terrae]